MVMIRNEVAVVVSWYSVANEIEATAVCCVDVVSDTLYSLNTSFCARQLCGPPTQITDQSSTFFPNHIVISQRTCIQNLLSLCSLRLASLYHAYNKKLI